LNTIPELLSPAGDIERLKAAVLFGADAVYLAGTEFGMRTAPKNFGGEELKAAVDLAHSKGVRVYMTCNTIPRNEELQRLPAYLEAAEAACVDALITADLGTLRLAQRHAPNTAIHISTQAGICNHAAATAFYELGASRVVLAREISLEEIAEIRANTPAQLELEAFVHGSMCVSFAGRCLLSEYLTGRDANRGDCAQPCRWKYSLMEEKREGVYFPIVEGEEGTHILNSRDMCMIEHIPELIKAGVSSFKLEGRAKSAYYTAVVTNAYRAALDAYRAKPEGFALPEWVLAELNKVSHREYSTGFYLGGAPGQVYENGGYVRDYKVVAIAEECRDGFIIASQRNKFSVGDTLDVLEPGSQPFELEISSMLNAKDEPIPNAPHPMMLLKIPFDGVVKQGTLLRISQQL
jgi:putative protease